MRPMRAVDKFGTANLGPRRLRIVPLRLCLEEQRRGTQSFRTRCSEVCCNPCTEAGRSAERQPLGYVLVVRLLRVKRTNKALSVVTLSTRLCGASARTSRTYSHRNLHFNHLALCNSSHQGKTCSWDYQQYLGIHWKRTQRMLHPF